EWQKVVTGTPDVILRSEAFGMDHTRSPQAVEARRESRLLKAKKKATGKLTPEEEERMHQYDMFVNTADSDLSTSDC
ncbi:MAG TPA: AAA family ATPase, partial [Plasticicumulans sp.]|nr:AAA family ATPase [Plasticicumulans sp.]